MMLDLMLETCGLCLGKLFLSPLMKAWEAFKHKFTLYTKLTKKLFSGSNSFWLSEIIIASHSYEFYHHIARCCTNWIVNTTYYDENQAVIQKEEETLAANMVMTL